MGREAQPLRARETLVNMGRLMASEGSVHLCFLFWYFEKEVTIGVFPRTIVSHSENVIPVLWGSVLTDTACYWVLTTIFIVIGH